MGKLTDGVSETVKHEIKKTQEYVFLTVLLRTFGALIWGNMLIATGLMIVGRGYNATRI